MSYLMTNVEIFLKNYEEAIEKTISKCFTVEMKRLKEVEEQNARLTDEMRKCEEYADRLNKENEKLKASANEAKIEFENLLINRNEFAERVERLKQENKELKEKIKDLESITGIFSVRLMEKYKQAIEEIREIIDEQKPILDNTVSQSEFTIEKLCDYDEKYIKIVGKIDEVLNDRD